MTTDPVRILNVNDSASNRYYVSRVLKAAGWEVLEAGTGAEGLELARTRSPRVVVLDIKLPDMSGLEVCRMLRADPVTADVIVIQTSATFVTSEGKARGLESGADQYLTQPFESVELVAMVRNLLRLREKESESRGRAEALAEADRRKDEFLAMLAHELRNPLSAISTATGLLQQQALDERGAKLATTIDRQTRHLARLVDDLLDVSRITRGKIQLRQSPLDLGATLRQFVESDAAAVASQHHLSLSVSDEPMWILADPTRIDQILSNLLGNATKYTQSGGKIAISLGPLVRGDSRFACLKIRDTGIGIAKENLGSVFDLFFQVDDSLARSQSGLGIGLTMVKRLLEIHGGNIVAESEGPGKGAEFRIELPMIAVPSSAVAVTSATPAERPLSILLIDDNVDSCELYALSLDDRGHKVRTAHDGAAGLELALAGDYDVAVVDIGLPDVDGYEIAKQVREQSATAPVLLALTGYGREEDRKRALEAGFDAHLVKPVNIADFHATVAKLAAKRAADRASAEGEHDGDQRSA